MAHVKTHLGYGLACFWTTIYHALEPVTHGLKPLLSSCRCHVLCTSPQKVTKTNIILDVEKVMQSSHATRIIYLLAKKFPGLPKATRGNEGFSPRANNKTMALQIVSISYFGFCSFKPPSLWNFIRATFGNGNKFSGLTLISIQIQSYLGLQT